MFIIAAVPAPIATPAAIPTGSLSIESVLAPITAPVPIANNLGSILFIIYPYI